MTYIIPYGGCEYKYDPDVGQKLVDKIMINSARDRLESIPSDTGGYGEAVLSVYQHLRKGQFYEDLALVLGSMKD